MQFASLICSVILAVTAWPAHHVAPRSTPKQAARAETDEQDREIRIGIIGLDTSHVIAFTRLFNDEASAAAFNNCRVVCAYPHGSPDIQSSVSRVPKYTEQIKEMGVEIVDSIETLVDRVDAVLLESNDGRPHLQQILPVLRAQKPVFVDKPIAGSLVDAIALFEAARQSNTPVFSSSSLRFSEPSQQARRGDLVGEVIGCETFSPCVLEATHPDLYWYGIHGVEQLFTVMGAGCQSVVRISTPGTDVVVGTWADGRIGTFRGTRTGPHHYGGTVFGTNGQAATGGNPGYQPLVTEIAKFFRSGKSPIDSAETLEIYAFMTAADESKRQEGKAISISEVLAAAKRETASRLIEIGWID